VVIPREASLAVELCLGAAAAASFAAMLMRSPRAGTIAWRAMLLGGIAAAIAAVLTFRIDAVWFFEALRVDTMTQALKGLIAVGVVVTAARRPSADPRAVVPFFALVAALGLSLAAGAGDLVVLWIALDIASAALVLAVATGGRAQERAVEVRRLLGAWLPMSLLMLLGIIMTAGIAGSTRLTDLETILPSMRGVPVALVGVVLIALSIVIRGARYVAVLLRG
jgi:NADH-quinone oxidoreductase subunit N